MFKKDPEKDQSTHHEMKFIEHKFMYSSDTFSEGVRTDLLPKQECQAEMLMFIVRMLWRNLASSGSNK